MNWLPLDFSKHAGKTLPQIIFSDPDWFFWAINDGDVFRNRPAYKRQADLIYQRATSIRIPPEGAIPRQVEYKLFDGKFYGFDIVEANRPTHQGSTSTVRDDHIDMEFPFSLANYDKLGYKHFLHSLKFHLFGDEATRMTKQKCEKFFSNSENFI